MPRAPRAAPTPGPRSAGPWNPRSRRNRGRSPSGTRSGMGLGSMGISGSSNGGIVPYKAIFWGYIPLHRPYIGLIYGRYLQFRFLKWPLIGDGDMSWGYPQIIHEIYRRFSHGKTYRAIGVPRYPHLRKPSYMGMGVFFNAFYWMIDDNWWIFDDSWI